MMAGAGNGRTSKYVGTTLGSKQEGGRELKVQG